MTELKAQRVEDDSKSLSKSTFRATLGVFLSRFSGLFRAQIVNAVFGAGLALDAFNVAQRIPSSLRDLFAEGALSAAFTKTLVAAKAHSVEEERRLIAAVNGFFGVVTLLLSFLGYFFSKEIMSLITHDKFQDAGATELTQILFRFMVFYLPLAMLSAVSMSILGTRRMTFRATIASAFFNVGTILGALILTPLFAYYGKDGVLGLALGTLLGGFLQWVYQTIPLFKLKLVPTPTFNLLFWKEPRLFEIVKLMGPRMISQGATTLTLLINTYFTTQVGIGAVTHVTNAQTLILVPIGLFGVAAGFSSLPFLSEAVVEKNGEKFSRLLCQSLEPVMWLSLFTIFIFAILALPATVILFEHGNFSHEAAFWTAVALCAYSVSILFNSMMKVLIQGFYAIGDTKASVFVALFSLISAGTLSSILAPRFGLIGLGYSNSISAFLSIIITLVLLKRVSPTDPFAYFKEKRISLKGRMSGFSVIAFLFSALGIYLVFLQEKTLELNFINSLLLAAALGATSLVVFFVLVLWKGPEQLQSVARAIKRRILRS